MMFQTLRKLPPRNSIQESVLAVYTLRRDQLEFMRTFVAVQAVVSAKEAGSAFEDYKNMLFPWNKEAKKDKGAQVIQKLLQETSKGPLQISSLLPTKARSRLLERMKR